MVPYHGATVHTINLGENRLLSLLKILLYCYRSNGDRFSPLFVESNATSTPVSQRPKFKVPFLFDQF
jgi:hypothetical protein